MAKKQTKLIITIPPELRTNIANTDFIHNGDGALYFHNPNVFKKIKQKDLIVEHDESRLIGATVGNNKVHASYEVSLAELERFVKKAKKRQEYFKRISKKKKRKSWSDSFFLHFNAELSFFIKK